VNIELFEERSLSTTPAPDYCHRVIFDSHGWASAPVDVLPANAAYSLFSAETTARIDIAQLAHKARTFFATALEIDPAKAYPDGRTPDSDALYVDIKPLGKTSVAPTRVYVVTFLLEREPAFRKVGDAAAAAIGGAGMDVLVARAKRIWQVAQDRQQGDDIHAPLRVAAILAAVLLAPIVPPAGQTIYGVKGARERLERLL
jgi:hypothetical protein